ncbi:MAG: hypothetical protein GQE15_17345 [Archangiaceae bacterium]|nr:hypothetical protein [Archangiaceae bacterium]
MRMLVGSVVLLAAVAAAAPNPKIREGRKLLEDLELEKAARTLAAAEATPGNDRAQVLELLELQGIVFGTMNKEPKARDAFRALLTLNPEFKLSGDHPPRVRTPFYEAKDWVAENAPLQLEPGATTGPKVTSLNVLVKKDTLRLVKKARFVLTEGPEPLSREVPIEAGAAKAPLEAAKVVWRVELLGKHDEVLLELGPFTHEGTDKAPAPVATTPPKPVETAVVTVEPKTTAPTTGSWLRPAGYAAAGAGVVAIGVGVAFGLLSNGSRARVTGAATNEAGLVTGISQRDAAAAEAQARSQATIANVMFGLGGTLVVAGAVLFFVGAPASPAQVSIGFSPTGVAVSGVFP